MSEKAFSFLEHIKVKTFPDEEYIIAKYAANIISSKILENNKENKPTVLGLPTGSTPLDVYRELIRKHIEEKLDFTNVITFNLDEYYGLKKTDINSYFLFMFENFFNHVNIKKENIHIPDGELPEAKAEEFCLQYEEKIKKCGGIDIILLGIGKDGHIGFNEPESKITTSTRLVTLNEVTRTDALSSFGIRKFIPTQAVSMGVSTIMSAKQVILMATGDHKAKIIKETVEGKITESIVASYLQNHSNCIFLIDNAAASLLTRNVTPWITFNYDWSNLLHRLKAVCYLSENINKKISDLEVTDFLLHSLPDLVRQYPIEKLKEECLLTLNNKMKTNSQIPKNEVIIVFSPHPDDDIISMGGMLRKLTEQKNRVICVYMTPGSNAIFDHDVEKFIIAREKFAQVYGLKISKDEEDSFKKIFKFFREKENSKFGLVDIPEVQKIKQLIREVEAISVCNFVNVAGYEFLTLPLYMTGTAKKNPVTDADRKIVKEIIEKYNPTQIFAAGDLTDPNGTHRLCLKTIIDAQSLIPQEKKPQLWLYRGAWQEFKPYETDLFITMTKEEILLKREGIFRHQSQKDLPPQPGHGTGEFWQRSEERNIKTANLLRSYGIEIPSDSGVEGFKIYRADSPNK